MTSNDPAPGSYRLCHQDEFLQKPTIEFRLGEGDWPLRLFVVRDGDNWRAFQNFCPHAGFPLNWSPDVFLTPDQDWIQCQVHGALFDKLTGDCVAGPCPGESLRSFPVAVNSNGEVVVEIS